MGAERDSGATRAATQSARESDGRPAAPGPKTQATLQLAAERLVSGTAGTVQDVLEGAVVGHYAEGLRQYLAIRTGDAERAKAVFSQLRDRVAAVGIEELSAPPGARARLYRMAREMAAAEAGGPAKAAGGTLLFVRPSPAPPSYSQAIEKIRADPRAGGRELLELKHARSLSTEEIAFVVGRPPAETEAALEEALEEARGLFAGGAKDLPSALLEAFALERLDQEVGSAREEGEEPLVPVKTVLDGRYELVRHVGSGGFADVYLARDIAVPGHQVALKLLKRKAASDEARDAALRELRLIAAVFHPSIVQFKDHGWYDDRFWFVMPWYEGETLEARIEREPLSRPEARRIFEPLARALATMHAAGIRHQDVKPDNIFLARLKGFGIEEEERVLPVLIDLGVAATDAELVLAGTPTYFAPEVAAQFAYVQGEPPPEYPIGPAADVFALALTLRNALEPETQPEVLAGNVDAFIAQRAKEVPEPPTKKELRFLRGPLRRWMAMDPAERPTADELADALAVLTQPEERRARRLRILRTFGPILIALLVVFGFVVRGLRERARVQADKAEAAAAREAEALADLEESDAEREEMRVKIAEAEQRIASSTLSRQDLETQLAEATGTLSVTRTRLTRARRALATREKALEAAQESLGEAEAARDAARARVEELERAAEARGRELEEARRALSAREAELAAARAATGEAAAARDAAQAAQREAEARATAAERERDAARAAQREAEAEVARLRAEVARLERRLASRPAAPTPTMPTPTPTTPTPTTPTPSSMTPSPMTERPTIMVRPSR